MRFLRSIILILIAGNIASFGNFLYNLLMGRMLTPAAFGELEATLSLSVLSAVPLSVLSIFIVKIVSAFWGQKKFAEAQTFLSVHRQKLLLVGLVGGIILMLLNSVVGQLLNASSVLPMIFLSVSFLLSGLATVNNAGLHGTLAFGYIAANGIIGTAAKLIAAVVLVFLNFQLSGALLGPLFGLLLGLMLSSLELKVIFKDRVKKQKTLPPSLLKTTFFPVLCASLAMTAFLTVDVILARYFFTGALSGEYAIVSVMGKVVYYAVGPISSVMFPIISSRANSATPYMLPLLGSLSMALGIGSVISFAFFMFPKAIFSLLFAGKYLTTAAYLGPYSFFMILFSVNSVLTYFLLSVSYYKPMPLLFGISLLQGGLIILFHNSIDQLIWINILVSAIYLFVVSAFVIKKECFRINFP